MHREFKALKTSGLEALLTYRGKGDVKTLQHRLWPLPKREESVGHGLV